MHFRRLLPASIGLVLSITSIAVAQQTAPQTPSSPENNVKQNRVKPDGPRKRGMRPRKPFGPGKRDALAQLNLSDEQRQQRKAIAQRHLDATKAQREQLFQMRQKRMEGSLTEEDRVRAQALRQEMRSTMKGMRDEMRTSLTAEQRSQFDALREQRKQRREEMMNQREELRRRRP